MKTFIPKTGEIDQAWYVTDAEGRILGRIAVQIARVLRGKHKPQFTPHMDVGDYVVVVNAERVRLSGTKETKKTYFRYTGYPGGARFRTVAQVRKRRPEELIRHAVRGMLPKNRLGRKLLRKLKVYAGPEHRHAAQRPQRTALLD